MLPLIALVLGLICAVTSRLLLFMAAMRTSAGWAVGVWFPFGPLFFRLSYPEEARRSMTFRYLTVALLLFYLVTGPGPSLKHLNYRKVKADAKGAPKPGDMLYYGAQKSSVDLVQTRTVNDQELVRLRKWYDELKLRKRDLLNSDVAGNRAYAADLALYHEALARTMVERNALDAMSK